MNDRASLPAAAPQPAPKPALRSGGDLVAIVPQSLDEVFRLAQAVSMSGLAPNGMEAPEKLTIAILQGMEVGLKPMQAIQSIAVINKRPTIWGDGLMAVVRQSPACKFVREWIEGEGDDMVAFCETHRVGEDRPVQRTFSVDDAKKAGLWGKAGPWTLYRKRMMAMRARAWCLRDVYADVLKGMQVREEVEDYEMRDVTPAAPRTSGLAARLAGNTNGDGFKARQIEAHQSGADPETGEIIEPQDPPREAVEGSAERPAKLVEASTSAEAGIAGQPAETPAATGGTSGANVSGDTHAQGVTAGKTAHQPDLGLGDTSAPDPETPASDTHVAGGASDAAGADSPSAGLADLLQEYAQALWRTPSVDKLQAKADEFWAAKPGGSKPGAKSPFAPLFREVMKAHENRVAAGSDETKALLAEIVERGRAA